jgi:hypothetical protein
MDKIAIPPDQNGYGLTPASGVLVSVLDGGSPRTRADIFDGWATANVQWTLNELGYEYLSAIAYLCEQRGGYRFLIDLFFYVSELTECTAMFVPGTFKLASQTGLSFVCTASLYVAPPVLAPSAWPTLPTGA